MQGARNNFTLDRGLLVLVVPQGAGPADPPPAGLAAVALNASAHSCLFECRGACGVMVGKVDLRRDRATSRKSTER